MTAMEVVQFLKKNSSGWGGNEHEKLFVGIELKENKKLVGELMFKYWSKENRQGEIGFRLNSDYQKMGIATEAALNLINFLFQRLELHKIIAICDTENFRSYSLMERLGMFRESHYKEHVLLNGTWRDQFQYALLRSKWDGVNLKANLKKVIND
jgi:RimJ/RimL family protein N-acetyltransferase